MGNFSKNLQKSNLLDQMQRQLNIAELAEARSVFMVATYESMYGELPQPFLERVQAEVSKTNPKTKGDFYRSVFAAAQLVDQEMQIEEAEARRPTDGLLEMAAASLAPSHNADIGLPSAED